MKLYVHAHLCGVCFDLFLVKVIHAFNESILINEATQKNDEINRCLRNDPGFWSNCGGSNVDLMKSDSNIDQNLLPPLQM